MVFSEPLSVVTCAILSFLRAKAIPWFGKGISISYSSIGDLSLFSLLTIIENVAVEIYV